jgi:hypothetical protein
MKTNPMKLDVISKLRIPVFGQGAASFLYPSAGNPRVALLASGFRETRQIRCFSRLDSEEAVRFDPQVLAGTAGQLRRIALGHAPVTLRNAVVVFTYEGEPGLSDRDRDTFWDVFGVPAFEQYLTCRNRLIATECDAHYGLHVHGPVPRRADWQFDASTCGCGDQQPRLLRTRGVIAPALELCVEQP